MVQISFQDADIPMQLMDIAFFCVNLYHGGGWFNHYYESHYKHNEHILMLNCNAE